MGSKALNKPFSIYGELKQLVFTKTIHPLKASSLIMTAIQNGHEPPEVHPRNQMYLRNLLKRYMKRNMHKLAMEEISRTLSRNLITELELLSPMSELYLDCLIRTLPAGNQPPIHRKVQLQRAVNFVKEHDPNKGDNMEIPGPLLERLIEKCLAADMTDSVRQLFHVGKQRHIQIEAATWNRYLSVASSGRILHILAEMYHDKTWLNPKSIVTVLTRIRNSESNTIEHENRTKAHQIIDTAKLMGAYNEWIAVEEMTLLRDEKRFTDVVTVFMKEYGTDLLHQFGFEVPHAEESPTVQRLEVTKYSLSILLDALVHINPHPKSLSALRKAYLAYTKDKEEFKTDIYGPTIFIRAFAKHTSSIPMAVHILDTMRKENMKPEVVSYTNVIEGLCRNHMMDLAARVLDYMATDGVEPNEITYGILLKGYTAVNDSDGIDTCRHILARLAQQKAAKEQEHLKTDANTNKL